MYHRHLGLHKVLKNCWFSKQVKELLVRAIFSVGRNRIVIDQKLNWFLYMQLKTGKLPLTWYESLTQYWFVNKHIYVHMQHTKTQMFG